jgi:hypothetical protein
MDVRTRKQIWRKLYPHHIGAVFAGQHRHVVPRVVDHLVAAEAAGMTGELEKVMDAIKADAMSVERE